MKLKKAKKGFTLVELVVVIAIIAVLSTVSVVGYFGFTKKANISGDKALVSQLNTILKADQATNGKAETPTEAIEAVKESGYLVEKLAAKTSKYKIVWNQKDNEFALLDEEEKAVAGKVSSNAYENWVFADSYNAEKGYSVYLNSGYSGNSTLDITTGLDVGENTSVEVVNYTNTESAKHVVIRTNGGKLTVSAPLDTVEHYEKADKVTIEAVAMNSYHEYGEVVGDLEVKKGRVEVTEEGKVGTVLVSSAAEGDVKVEVETGAEIGTVAPTTDEAKKDINASTTIPTDSKQDTVVIPNTDFAGGLGTEKSPYLIGTADEFYKISNYLGGYYFKQIKDIEISHSVSKIAGVFDGNNYSLSYFLDSGTYSYVFSEMAGYTEFKNINLIMGKIGISLLNIADWGTSYGVTFENITFNSTESMTTVNANNFGFAVVNALYTTGEGKAVYTFKNITNNVNLQNEGTCTGFLVGSGPCFNAQAEMYYINCVNKGIISGTSSVGFLYGNSAYIESVSESNSEIHVENCKNNSKFSSIKDGAIVAFAPKLDNLNEMYQESVGGSFLANSYLNGKDFTVNQNGSTFIINTKDNSVYYKLMVDVSATYWKQDGQAWTDSEVALLDSEETKEEALKKVWNVSNGTKYMINLEINTNETGDLSTTFKAYDKITAKNNGINATSFTNGIAIVVKDNVTYFVIETGASTYINSSITLSVNAYDASGILLGTQKIK